VGPSQPSLAILGHASTTITKHFKPQPNMKKQQDLQEGPQDDQLLEINKHHSTSPSTFDQTY